MSCGSKLSHSVDAFMDISVVQGQGALPRLPLESLVYGPTLAKLGVFIPWGVTACRKHCVSSTQQPRDKVLGDASYLISRLQYHQTIVVTHPVRDTSGLNVARNSGCHTGLDYHTGGASPDIKVRH